eukprot:m.76201 g.76201  ORF g.76201 m.76201 type:complete len:65 (+) comp35975_c0_seq5:50-244(+)
MSCVSLSKVSCCFDENRMHTCVSTVSSLLSFTHAHYWFRPFSYQAMAQRNCKSAFLFFGNFLLS